ncbi:uncharacterized protein B0H18DRAFT_1087702 [Fomitopsis serialis]|uniref:uncharacterized protein n=1 Tax=Fomitopsis serialis TaxID=139415 RepID=UPI002008855D|nr:uncharacterized protein B0H18DRAFT_1087702 [Neoantrodia serialis]KAH9914938.1 hypothetical protein B0H18DRAFT_1087702 [Neoantrodia serialis]
MLQVEISVRGYRSTFVPCIHGRSRVSRCSRVFPCASCVKKGCAAICPDGHLTTGKGNRYVLANTGALHDKITQLSSRVRQLEDALKQAHGMSSLEPHPLLTEELKQIKRPLERESQGEQPQSADTEAAEVIDAAVGSLSITDSGLTRFYGTPANAWNEEGDEDAIENPQSILPTSLPWFNYAVPLGDSVHQTFPDVRASLVGLLPDITEARRLASLYFKHAAWMYTPIPEPEFHSTVLSRFYGEIAGWVDQDSDSSHKMAILFMIFAMGSLLDLDKASHSVEATKYYQLGRAALSLDSILEHQTISAIQALILMCHFMFLSNIDGPRWVVMGLATKLALAHEDRDGNKWNLNPDEAFRRRSLFYELLTYDSWQSITFGRPPSLSMTFIDCQLPQGAMSKSDGGEPEMSFAAWKHRFAAQCQSVVNEQVFGARLPSHRQLMELDEKIRNFYLPPSLRVRGFGGLMYESYEPATPPTYEQDLQGYCACAITEITIFYMHRGFFATALQQAPDDPLGHKYASSVLAAYKSACSYVGLIKSMYSQYPKLVERMWFYLTHVFSCGIVLGAIPSKSPGMKLARSAQAKLDTALGLFDAVQHDPRAAKVLPVLSKLKARAETSMVDYHTLSSAPRNIPSGLSPKDDDELGALQGKTRLISRKSPAGSTPSDGGSQSGSSPWDKPGQSLTPMGPPSMNAGISLVNSHHQYHDAPYNSVADAYSSVYAHVDGAELMQPDAWHNLVAHLTLLYADALSHVASLMARRRED